MILGFMYAGMLQSKQKSNWFILGTFRFLFKNLYQPIQDLSETGSTRHNIRPTGVGLPIDGVEQLVEKFHQKVECNFKRRSYYFHLTWKFTDY